MTTSPVNWSTSSSMDWRDSPSKCRWGSGQQRHRRCGLLASIAPLEITDNLQGRHVQMSENGARRVLCTGFCVRLLEAFLSYTNPWRPNLARDPDQDCLKSTPERPVEHSERPFPRLRPGVASHISPRQMGRHSLAAAGLLFPSLYASGSSLAIAGRQRAEHRSMAINRRAAQTTVPQQPSHCLRVQQVRVSFG